MDADADEEERGRINDAAEEISETVLDAGTEIAEHICKRRGLSDFEGGAATANAFWRIGVTATACIYELDLAHFSKRLNDLLKDELRTAPRTSQNQGD